MLKKPSLSTTSIILITLAAALLLAFAAGAYFIFLYSGVHAGARLDGKDMGGISKKELTEYISSMPAYGGVSALSFKMGNDSFEIPLSELGASVNVSETADMVYGYGRDGSFGQNLLRCLRLAPPENFHPIYNLDSELAKQKLREKAQSLTTSYEDSYYRMEGANLIINNGMPGVSFDVDACLNTIDEQIADGNFAPIEVPSSMVEPEALDLDAIIKELTLEPSDAKYEKDENGKLVLVPHITGLTFDKAALETALRIAPGEITFPSKPYEPKVTTESLEDHLFGDVLSDVITYLNMYNRPRTANIKLAAEIADGTILMPGDVYSYNRVVGERTYEKGYRDASVYTKDGNEDGLAGGICQLSSTIHMAAIRANLEIVERHNHMYAVPYCSPGEDATVYWGSLDFKFKNNRDYPVKIETIQAKDYVICRVYGTKIEDEPEVEIINNVHSRVGYSTKRVVDPSLAPGKTKVDQEGHSGAQSETYRVLKDKDGNEISRELLNKSRYVPLVEIIFYGADPEIPPDPPAPTDPVAPPADPLPPADPVTPPADPQDDPLTPPDPFEQLENLFGND